MVWWLFKKRDDTKWDSLHNTLKISFSNIKKEINHVKGLAHSSHSKHDSHNRQISSILERLEKMESHLWKSVPQQQQTSKTRLPSVSYDSEKIHETLTDMQQNFCRTLAALQKETPNKWISLKYLAQEIYPNKEYSQIRSTISQYISVIEDLGLVKRRRKGKQAFIMSTDKNPYAKKKKELLAEAKNKQED